MDWQFSKSVALKVIKDIKYLNIFPLEALPYHSFKGTLYISLLVSTTRCLLSDTFFLWISELDSSLGATLSRKTRQLRRTPKARSYLQWKAVPDWLHLSSFSFLKYLEYPLLLELGNILCLLLCKGTLRNWKWTNYLSFWRNSTFGVGDVVCSFVFYRQISFPAIWFFSHLLLLLPIKVRTAFKEPNKAFQVWSCDILLFQNHFRNQCCIST